MKSATLALGVLLSAMLPGGAGAESSGAATPGPACLQASSVDSTGVIDEKTILFHMRNGTVWKNTLRQSCPNLKFQRGFSEIVRGGEICANKQIISVLGTRNPCQLGAFTLVSKPSP
jgi:hypothetical protein